MILAKPLLVLALLVPFTAFGEEQYAIAQASTGASTSIAVDVRRATDLAKRAGGKVDLSELLRDAGSVELRSARPQSLLLYVHRMRGGRVIDTQRSTPFTVPANGVISLRDALQPGWPRYESHAFDANLIKQANEAVSASAAASDPDRFIINGVIPFKPKNWEQMDAFYIVAIPAESRLAEAATARFSVLFAMPERFD